MRVRYRCAESVPWLSRRHKDIVDVLVVAGVHREDGDVRAVFKQVLVKVCSEEVEDAVVVVVHRGDEVTLMGSSVFYDGFVEA